MRAKLYQLGFIAPLILMVIGLGIVFVGIVVYFQFRPSMSKIQSTPVPTAQPISMQSGETTNSTPQTSATEDWKTYSNQELGFSIKYPGNWFVYDNQIEPCKGNIPGYLFVNQIKITECIFADVPPADLIVYVQKIPEDPNYGPLPKSNEYDTYKSYDIAGEKGVINIRTEKSEGPRRMETSVYVNHKEPQYRLSYPNKDYLGSHDQIYNQILSTFKFLD